MVIVGSSYWIVGIGRDPGQVKEDAEATRTMETLGKNMAWLLKKIHSQARNFWKAAEIIAHKQYPCPKKCPSRSVQLRTLSSSSNNAFSCGEIA